MFSTASCWRDVGARNGRFERIQIHDDEIDRLDAVLRHDGIVSAAPAENPTVDLRVQRLDAAVHQFRKARVFGHFPRRDAGFRQRAMCVAGAQNFDAARRERRREFDDAGFVGNADERPADRTATWMSVISIGSSRP